MPLARLFFRNRHLTLLTVAVLIAAGLSALSNLPRLEDPRITTRNAIVITPYPGATAMRVEALVSKPLEDRLREIHEVKEIESTSRAGVSLITVELEDAIGPDRNEAVFSEIRDKLADAARKLPPEAGEPEFDDQRGAVAFSMVTAVGWGTVEPARLGILQRHAEELADRLRNIPATEIVRLYGKPEEEITVTVDAAELAALGLTAEEVAARVAAADPKAPAGTLRTPIRSTQLEVAGELDSLQRIGEIPLRENGSGAIVTLDDVGELNRSWRDPPLEIAYADGGRAVFVAARVVADARVDDWAQRARSIVEAFALEVGGGIEVEVLFDQSRYTESRLANLGGNLSAGAAVVMLVVFFAMGWRAALIVGLALPLSAGAALFGLGFFGEPIHQMTVFGLIVAIGLLIDNAIVVTEDVRQRLALGRSREQAVAAATRHLFAPLLASTLTTVLGFMPVFLLPGNVGDFVGPIAISVILALLASFLVSVTVIAVLAARYQSRRDDGEPAGWWREGLEPGRLGRLYAEFIRRSVRRPLPTLGVVLLLPTIGFALASTLDNQFFPPAERDQFEIEVRLRKGASIHRVAALSREIDALIRQEAAVARVDWLIGGSFPSVYYNLIMNQDGDPAYAHAIVTATDAAATYGLIPALQTALDEAFPQAQTVVSAFGQGPP